MSSITHNSVETEATITALKAEIETAWRSAAAERDLVDKYKNKLAACQKERDDWRREYYSAIGMGEIA